MRDASTFRITAFSDLLSRESSRPPMPSTARIKSSCFCDKPATCARCCALVNLPPCFFAPSPCATASGASPRRTTTSISPWARSTRESTEARELPGKARWETSGMGRGWAASGEARLKANKRESRKSLRII